MLPEGLTSEFVQSTLGTSKVPDAQFTHVTTDSRKITPGCLFVAIPGEKFDGHDFIPQAIEKGATGVISSRPVALPGKCAIFEVADTIQAYRKLAHAWRMRFSFPVVAVAGSVGKTTTKEILTAILRGKYETVLKTEGSQNGFVGIPMTLLELRPSHQAAVIEVGIDEPGAMEQHVDLVHPTASVLTAIGPEHLEKLHDIETVAHEEGIALSMVARAGGVVAINLGDPHIEPYSVRLLGAKRACFKLWPSRAKARPDEDTLFGWMSGDGALELQGLGLDGKRLALPLPGEHNASNLLAAIALSRALGLSFGEIEAGLKTFAGASGRSEIRELPGGTPAVCDYYNASPKSTEAGLDLLARVAGPSRRRWACLGDMLELGPKEADYHRGLSGKLCSLGIENVLLYGARMRALAAELVALKAAGKCAAERIEHFTDHAAMAARLKESFRPGDAILIKGSRGMRMEEVWKNFEAFAREQWKS